MIVTVTLNPAVDEGYVVRDFNPGGWFRAVSSDRSPGGKGINVSLLLNQLGHESAAMGFLAGFNGDYIRDVLRRLRITTNFVHVTGETRTNVYVVDETGRVETGISESGPEISEDALTRFLSNYRRMLNRASVVVIGGSIPPGVPQDIYRDLVSMAKDVGVETFVDAAGPAFMAGIEAGPSFAKIDHRFMSQLSGTPLSTLDNLIRAVSDLHDLGVNWAVSSYHVYGDVFFTPDGIYLAKLGDRTDVVSMFGASDALVAGLVVGYMEGMSPEEAIRFSMGCAMEDATHMAKGISGREAVERYMSTVEIEKLR
ncbi:1-phosphofructokinase [Dethiosulfovibrio peptidovorans DSM 11002]|jgi:1-phosphofructokinase family hexose kinase|uniref:1-phosphofructokinase n=1 Tax=Dethiosulfovibrio peptidovorans DSM 11002 TaxID=469381 RepID=D2Z2R5_9BACT|nr:1-phosphofructokinase family hexose kinase [Dethiosulfovibrio peptidovorans]EFC92078.1 1-phosphofructokinase [Dethiosulfovibrio peptidovorans DSM 11002]